LAARNNITDAAVIQSVADSLERLYNHEEQRTDQEHFKIALYTLYLDGISPPYACPVCRVLVTSPPVPSMALRTLVNSAERPLQAIKMALGRERDEPAPAATRGLKDWRGWFLSDTERSRLDAYKDTISDELLNSYVVDID
jgi:hypothetical protein